MEEYRRAKLSVESVERRADEECRTKLKKCEREKEKKREGNIFQVIEDVKRVMLKTRVEVSDI